MKDPTVPEAPPSPKICQNCSNWQYLGIFSKQHKLLGNCLEKQQAISGESSCPEWKEKE
jgi:hypothetical protein